MLLKVLACDIARREICHCAARSPNIVDLEFLPQGLHDTPAQGRAELQRRIEAVPAGAYQAVLVGYGLCGGILHGLRAGATPLVIPRAHDCITFFLGSKARYQQRFAQQPGTYYFTAGWLEVPARRAAQPGSGPGVFLPAQSALALQAQAATWAARYGEDAARFLSEELQRWTRHYTHGALIEWDFARPLKLDRQVRQICADQGWQFEAVPGDPGLLQRWLDGAWVPEEFLVLPPGHQVVPSHDDLILAAEPA